MHKYVLKFSKKGYIKYISHLDLLRLFKRSFKRLEVKLAYSQGFNPHPKMGFAQPLSLGYESNGEILEFETLEEINPKLLQESMNQIMPEGLQILQCKELSGHGKSLAAITEAAIYEICIPYKKINSENISEGLFLAQPEIMVQKMNKKKELVNLDIKGMIRSLELGDSDAGLLIRGTLDAGSISNLSPELLILAIGRFYELDYERSEVEVIREALIFGNKYQI